MHVGTVRAGARAVLADALINLAGGSAFWFTINCASHPEHKFSLCSRLGMTIRDFEALLVGAQLEFEALDSWEGGGDKRRRRRRKMRACVAVVRCSAK